jgi:hypothetical protein
MGRTRKVQQNHTLRADFVLAIAANRAFKKGEFNRLFEAVMHKNPDARRITVTVTPDVMDLLEAWAARNLSSLSAETVRTVRERAAQEAREKVVAA